MTSTFRKQMLSKINQLGSIGDVQQGLIKLTSLARRDSNILRIMHENHIYTKSSVLSDLSDKIRHNSSKHRNDVPFLSDEMSSISKLSNKFVVVGVNDIVRDVTPSDYIDLLDSIDNFYTYRHF